MSGPASGAGALGWAGRTGALRAAAASDVGRQRDHNEDRFLLDTQGGVFAVIDGLGGHAAGETAAELARQAIEKRLARRSGAPEERLREAVALANDEIRKAAESRPGCAGMGCVLTAAIVEHGALTAAHVGDSRLYLLRGSTLRKLTRDHSPVGEREDAGELGELEAMRHPRRNEVYRMVGSEPHGPDDPGFVDIVRVPFGAAEALLLCTDGLTDALTSKEIGRIVEEHGGDPRLVVDQLVEAANAARGDDNVTVVFAAGEAYRKGLGRTATPVEIETARDTTTLPAPPKSAIGRASTWLALGAGVLLGGLLLLLPDVLRSGAEAIPPAEAPTAAQDVPPIRVGPGDFRTISEAMGAARAGDTVLLADGLYHEAVRLPQGVTLRAEHPRRASIAPPRDPALPAIAIVADGLGAGRIAGLRIEPGEGGLDTGILVRNSAVEIDDCEVVGARRAAIELIGSSSGAVRSSFVHDNPGVGILVGSGALARLVHNHVLTNGTETGRQPGIAIEPGARPALAGNVIAANGAEGVRGLDPADHTQVLDDNLFEHGGRPNALGAVRVAAPAARAERR